MSARLSARLGRTLFGAAIFLASFLLFAVEPMVAKLLLPAFGGSAAVWMTCLVFFQLALLGGYLYAHALTRRRTHPAVHLTLLLFACVSALGWALDLIHPATPMRHPVLSIFAALALSIGMPFLLLASTSPLLQVWLALWTGRGEAERIPYRLFALSNLASLLALLAYPTVIEPHLTLTLQRNLWAAGVCLFALLSAVLTVTVASPKSRHDAEAAPKTGPVRPELRARLLWFLLPMAAAMQLSAVTAHLTSNIAAIPLLWILPLAVYLLSFILAFQFPRLASWRGILLRFLAVMLGSLAYFLSHTGVSLPVGLGILFFLIEAFFACLFCHTETYALRPENPVETTLFYLVVAAGGATGSFLIGIAAPLVFAGNYDLAITFLVTALLALVVVWPGSLAQAWPQRLLWSAGSGLLLFLVFAIHHAYLHNTLLATRNFYGSLRVQQTVTEHGAPIRTLLNGSIQHGTQIFSPELIHVPTTYYAENSGAGLALRTCCSGTPKRVGVIGLGAGTLAAYGRSGDSFRFYEINPAVLPIAQNLFTWLRDSAAQLSFVEGDGRASLAAEPPQNFDVLVVDAFSGDAIPLHLLTVEAFALYRRHLAPGGTLAFHVSNAYVDLEPEIAQLAASAKLEAYTISSPEDTQSGAFRSTWVLVPTQLPTERGVESFLANGTPRARVAQDVRPWTDDYSSLLSLIRW